MLALISKCAACTLRSVCGYLCSVPAMLCRLLRRMLMDLHELRIVSGQALETWRYKTNDTEAIKDVSSWLDELKQSDEGTQ